MTTAAGGRRKTDACDGVTTAFNAPQFESLSDLRVYLHSSAAFDPDTATLLTEGTDYTVTGSGPLGTAQVVTTSAYAAGHWLTRFRLTSRAQAAAFAPNDGIGAKKLETALDTAALIEEEQDDDLADVRARALLAPPGETLGLLAAAAARENTVLGFLSGAIRLFTPSSLAAWLASSLLPLLPGSFKGDPGGNVMAVGLFTALSGMTIPAGTKRVYVTGHGSEGIGPGWLVEDAAVDAAAVAANPLWMTLSNGGTRGWRRVLGEGDQRFIAEQFGADPLTKKSDTAPKKTTAAAANIAAWKAMRECAIYYRANAVDISFAPTSSRSDFRYCGTAPMGFGLGTYWLGGNSLLLTEGTYDVGGAGHGSIGSTSFPTLLAFDGTCDGIVVHTEDSYSGPEKLSAHGSAAGTRLHDFAIDLGAGPLDMDDPRIGLWFRATDVKATRVGVVDAGSTCFVFGNRPGLPDDIAPANNCFLEHCWGVNSGYAGLFIDGSDSSAGGTIGCSFIYTGYFGVYDSSFLANGHKDLHVRGVGSGFGSGTTTHPITTRVTVSHNGWYWHVVFGQHVAASTTEPGHDPTVWLPLEQYSPGSPDLTFGPAWVSGTTYASGGAYVSDNLNAPDAFIACYNEGDSPGIWSNAGIAIGGINEAQQVTGAANLRLTGGHLLNIAGSIGFNESVYDPAINSGAMPARIVSATLGGEYGLGTFFRINDNVDFIATLRHKVDRTAHDARIFEYANLTDTAAIVYAGPNTALNFGRTAPVPYAAVMQNLFVGTGNNARKITFDAPSGAVGHGDLFLSNAPSAGGSPGQSVTTGGTVGSTAVLKALANLAA